MPRVTVIGAGVIGLSTAIRAQDAGHNVTIVAQHLPGDLKNIHYTSPWAGAHHVSFAGNDKVLQAIDRETFEEMRQMSENEAEGCFMKLPQTEYYHEEPAQDNARANAVAYMPDFKYLEPEELPLGCNAGVSFTTLTIDTAVYLPYLLSRFLAKGGRIVRATIQHISQVAEGAFSPLAGLPEAIIVCAGIGARSLGGVDDSAVYPIRGQIVLVRAPWIKFGKTIKGSDGQFTYIIPRKSGDVILGGTATENDWYPNPIPEVTQGILQRCLDLCPELVPPHLRKDDERKPTIADIQPLVLETGCGLRPSRKGGIRLEKGEVMTRTGKPIALVYNYGHGGAGYQSSWGSATVAMRLLEEAFTERIQSPRSTTLLAMGN